MQLHAAGRYEIPVRLHAVCPPCAAINFSLAVPSVWYAGWAGPVVPIRYN